MYDAVKKNRASGVFKGLRCDTELFEDCPDSSLFQIPGTMIRNDCSPVGCGVEPFSMRTTTSPGDFPATQLFQFPCDLLVGH